MKITRFVGIFSLIALALFGQSTSPALTATCQIAGNPSYPDCVDGEVTFTGSNIAGSGGTATVYVTNSSNKVLDNFAYSLNGNTLTFTENLSLADTYTVSVNGTVMLTVTTSSRN